jgi:hypothetical protein
LPEAEQKITKQKRQAALKDLYSRAVRETDAEHWGEARRLLARVRAMEPGYRETEQLLARVEAEIERQEAERQRQEEIATLYEQALGLARARQWRQVLTKMEEIQTLDAEFADAEGIAGRAQEEVAQEEEEARRQNELAATYAEAVRLLKAEEYQEALEKWGEVETRDPRYPDRQRVQAKARKRLSALTRTTQPGLDLHRWRRKAREGLADLGEHAWELSPRRQLIILFALIVMVAASIALINLDWARGAFSAPTHTCVLFTSDRDGKQEIYRLSGAGLERVTYSPGQSESWSPAARPDGTVLFTSDRDGKREIYHLSGTGVERVTHSPGQSESWSPAARPDGTVLFTSDRDGKREIYHLSGTGVEQVTHSPGQSESW